MIKTLQSLTVGRITTNFYVRYRPATMSYIVGQLSGELFATYYFSNSKLFSLFFFMVIKGKWCWSGHPVWTVVSLPSDMWWWKIKEEEKEIITGTGASIAHTRRMREFIILILLFYKCCCSFLAVIFEFENFCVAISILSTANFN